MELKDIPDYITVKGIDDWKGIVNIYYTFNGKPKIIEVEKQDHDENWREVMEKKINQNRAFQVVVKEEEAELRRLTTAPAITSFFKDLNKAMGL